MVLVLLFTRGFNLNRRTVSYMPSRSRTANKMRSESAEDFEGDAPPTVINRRGELEEVRFDKITDRIKTLCSTAYGGRLNCNELHLAQMVIAGWYPGITTQKLDDILREKCCALSGESSDYTQLAGRVIVSNMHKNAELSGHFTFAATTAANSSELLNENGKPTGRLLPAYVEFVQDNASTIEDRIDYQRDFNNNGFTIATLQRSYLLKSEEGCTELPQHAYMRVALFTSCFQNADGEVVPVHEGLLASRLEQAFAAYDELSLKEVSMASPFLFNAGTRHAQMSSCYLMEADDSLASIYKVLSDSAMCSKHAGGIGISLSRLRAQGSTIGSSGGKASGLRKLLPLFNRSFGYANQNDRRPGSCAMSIEPWHEDVFLFLEMGRHDSPLAKEGAHAPNLKYALWMPDRFLLELEKEMRGEDAVWYLFSPDEAPGLTEVYDEIGPNHPTKPPGGSFSALYDRYVAEKRYRRGVPPMQIVREACITLGQRGFPYLLM
ncbi:MAG: ribonucleotide reductase N-terminal alpha domain-containing protein, partial [Sulfitobacter sp.]|nr:ribonucleotide reductase N-terminal alpha domain-containing protein [Sulfitobacter sp.]